MRVYVGRVGTGFNDELLRMLLQHFAQKHSSEVTRDDDPPQSVTVGGCERFAQL